MTGHRPRTSHHTDTPAVMLDLATTSIPTPALPLLGHFPFLLSSLFIVHATAQTHHLIIPHYHPHPSLHCTTLVHITALSSFSTGFTLVGSPRLSTPVCLLQYINADSKMSSSRDTGSCRIVRSSRTRA